MSKYRFDENIFIYNKVGVAFVYQKDLIYYFGYNTIQKCKQIEHGLFRRVGFCKPRSDYNYCLDMKVYELN